MEVGKINQNTQKIRPMVKNGVTFKGYAQRSLDTVSLGKKVYDVMPSIVQSFKKLEWLKGEVGGILITALGTGLVAPIFIAFNPLSNKDEDTKKYTALRQPVSAVLAILIQLGLLKPISEMYDRLCNSGKLGKHNSFNQEKLHSKNYWEKIAKQAKVTKEHLDDEVEIQRNNDVYKVATELKEKGIIDYSNNRKVEGKELLESINSALKERIEAQEKIVAKCTPEKVVEKSKRAYLLLTKGPVDENEDYILKVLCDKLKFVKSKEQAGDIVQEWVEQYAKDKPDLEEIANEFLRRDKLLDLRKRAEATISKIGTFEQAMENSKILAQNHKTIIDNLKKYETSSVDGKKAILELFEQLAGDRKVASEVGGLHQMVDMLKNTTDDALRTEFIDEYINRVDDFHKAGGNLEKMVKVYQAGYYHDKKRTAEITIDVLKSLKIGDDSPIKNVKGVISNISEKLRLGKDEMFEKEVVEQLRKKIEKKIKGYKQITSILVGLFITLPLTCTALNWVYPRFMDIFFPQLANNKKSDAPEEKVKQGGRK